MLSFKSVLVYLLLAGILIVPDHAIAIEDDKRLHAEVSAVTSLMVYSTFRYYEVDRLTSCVLAFSLTMAIGHIKESTDPFYDKDDMRANGIGAITGILIPLSFGF